MYLLKAGNDIVLAIVGGTLIFFLLGSFAIIQLLLLKKRQQQHKFEVEQIRIKFNEEILHAQLEIQEQTLKNIGQEIHDNIGQMLSLAKLNLNTIDLELREKAAEKIDSTRILVSKSIQDLRDLSRTLNTENIARIGLINAIESEMILVSKLGTVKADMELMGAYQKTDPQKELILFRIVQEAINNALKHAAATNLKVKAIYQPEVLTLMVIDDGVGFDTDQHDYSGSGLQNIRSRAKLINAQVSIQSTPEKGTQVHITLPTDK